MEYVVKGSLSSQSEGVELVRNSHTDGAGREEVNFSPLSPFKAVSTMAM
jgi:hypothetical protein